MRKLLQGFTAIALAATTWSACDTRAAAISIDAVPVVTCDTQTVAVGENLHCVVSNTDGLTPADKITWTNQVSRRTINVSNLAGQSFEINYRPSLGEAGRTEVITATICYQVPTNRCRTSAGHQSFTVASTVDPPVVSGFRGVMGSPCYYWRSSTNLSAAGYCTAGTYWSWVQITVLCYNPVTRLSTWHYGNRVYSPNVITNYTCPNGQYLLNDGTGSYALVKGA